MFDSFLLKSYLQEKLAGLVLQGCKKRGGGGVPTKVCPPWSPHPKFVPPQNNPFSPTFWVQVYAATCMCKQTAALQPLVPASLCV